MKYDPIVKRILWNTFSDVSGGPSPSIIESMRRAMDVSIQQCFRDCTKTVLNYKEVFYLATLGGAKGKYSYEYLDLFKSLLYSSSGY